jgi:hypothetical protein
MRVKRKRTIIVVILAIYVAYDISSEQGEALARNYVDGAVSEHRGPKTSCHAI